MKPNYLLEVQKILSALPKKASSQVPESYIGGGKSKLKFLGLSVPQLRKVSKRGFTFSDLSQNQVAMIWNDLWEQSNCYEVLSLALMWFQAPKQKTVLLRYWPMLKTWSSKVDNWAHSDSLSAIFSQLLEKDPETVFPTFEKWNHSSNPWLRRLSLVSLIYFSSQRTVILPYKNIIRLIRPQLDYQHYYVQKGLGWTLRETGRVYPDETFEFLKKHAPDLSPAAFGPAIEKLTAAEKKQIKGLRKSRKKSGARKS